MKNATVTYDAATVEEFYRSLEAATVAVETATVEPPSDLERFAATVDRWLDTVKDV